MCKFWDPRSRDLELTHKNTSKMRFLAWKFINSSLTQKPLGVQSWNLHTMWVLINVLCKLSLGAPGHVTKMLQVENGQKVDDFEPIHLGKYQLWWKMICGFWAHYQLPFCWLCSFTPTRILFFFFFVFFLTFFFFLLRLSTFKPLNALYSKFERLKISGKTSAGMKSGVPGWRIPLNRVLLNFELLNR